MGGGGGVPGRVDQYPCHQPRASDATQHTHNHPHRPHKQKQNPTPKKNKKKQQQVCHAVFRRPSALRPHSATAAAKANARAQEEQERRVRWVIYVILYM